MKPEYSVVIPVYGSGPWLDELVTRIGRSLNSAGIASYELVLVNDCSPDTVTWPAIVRNSAAHPWVKGVDLVYNVGQFRALLCGMEHAAADLVITMDDDLQHPPEELPKLITAARENPDSLCIMGQYETKEHNSLRNLGVGLVRRFLGRAYGMPKDLRTTSFRLMRRPLVEAMLAFRIAKPQPGPQIVALTRRITNVPVRHDPRPSGSSNYSLFSLVRTTVDSVVHASTAPLRFFSAFGFLCSAAAFAFGFVMFLRWLTGRIGVAGYTSIILLVIFFGGLTLAGIGVLGEYVARIISEVTGPRRWLVGEKCGDWTGDRGD